MIPRVVVHLLNEQPVLVDLLEMPKPADNGLVCTNVRMLDGRKPIFIDRSDSTFYFPYLNVRFIEIPGDRQEQAPPVGMGAEAVAETVPADDEDLEIDEDFLRRIRDA
ncbi:MAG: hypothetical protein HY264_06615 [Chloroflexi bacterium]|nr:hypothetical protein [Chloroflexota bacterium]